ncbi:trypsin-like peptidase domain-containing protein [Oceanospirillaceae bacterium]|jgi:serine protease DegS|nr:trypsin-like peptidase domain-containing protein [Oceanospirillaceae bacterium]|tara:strand:+ start:3218 stop:4366 length:1149 start_codon:yes stop_codon:yes gene_type:complete
MTRSLIKYLLRFALAGILLATALIFASPQWLSQKTGIPLWSQKASETTFNTTHSYADLLEATMGSVVRIYSQTSTTPTSLALLQDPHYASILEGQLIDIVASDVNLGSGVIASRDGHILTNNHVIENAERIQVSLADGRFAPALLVGTDPATDLAVIKIQLDNLTPAKVPINLDSRVGDIVFAIGNPHGLGQSVSMGIISGKERNRLGLNTFESFIQTDAAINAGNSGGALINTRGELVGINTAHFYNSSTSARSQGIGLAIPINIAFDVLQSLVQEGVVIRGWLGIDFNVFKRQYSQNAFSSEEATGIMLSGVYANSPAHIAGLKPGDLITHFDGNVVKDWNESLNYVTSLSPGSELDITYRRSDDTYTVTAILGTRPTAK